MQLIIVGYETKPKFNPEELAAMAPEFQAPSNYKQADAIEKYINEKKKAYAAEASSSLYTGELSTIVATNLFHWKNVTHVADTEGEKGVVARKFGRTLRTWAKTDNGTHDWNQLVLIGFGVRKFIKMLGTECAVAGEPVDPWLWSDSTRHYDLDRWLTPDGFITSTLDLALRAYGFKQTPSGWTHPELDDPKPVTWAGVGKSAVTDVKVATLLAVKLGLIGKK